MDVLMCVCAALGLIALYIFLRQSPRAGKAIPGPAGWPIVGYAFKMKPETVHDTFAELAEKYGDIFSLNVFGAPTIVLNKSEMIRTCFCDDPYKQHTNDRLKTFIGHWIFGDKAIFTTQSAKNSPHGDLRKVFVRGMHVYGDGIKKFEEKVHLGLVKLNDSIESYNGKEFDMQELLKRSLSNVISNFLSGQGIENDNPEANIFWEFDRLFNYFLRPDVELILRTFPALRCVPGLYKKPFDAITWARDVIFKRYFHEAKRSYKPGTVRGLVDFYLTEQHKAETEGRPVLLTDDQICSLILETVAAALISTFSALSSAFLCLINHPGYQTKIQEELDRVVGREKLPTVSDRQHCAFTEAVTLEVQRYITVGPTLIPHSCKSNMEFEGYDIPANSVIYGNVWFVHHDEKVWGDPWAFRPERWLDDDGDLLPNDHILRKNWLPFGTGRRQCPGESLARSWIFLFVSSLLQRWSFEMLPEHAMPCDPRMGYIDADVACRPKPYLCRTVPRK